MSSIARRASLGPVVIPGVYDGCNRTFNAFEWDDYENG